MKKIALMGLLFLMMFVSTGCKKFSYNVEIDKDGYLNIAETCAINRAAIEAIPGGLERVSSLFESITSKNSSEGYNVKSFEDRDYVGLTRFKKPLNVMVAKNENLPKGFTSLQAQPVVMDNTFLKNRYTIKWTYDINKALENLDIIAEDNLNKSKELRLNRDEEIVRRAFSEAIKPVADLTITLPAKAISHNANKVSVDGKNYVYKWNISSLNETENIELVYEKVEYTGSVMVISFILLFIGLVVVMLKMKEESSF